MISAENTTIQRAYKECSTAICLASNQAYLAYAAVTIHSVLRHGSTDRSYDILVMSQDMTEENWQDLKQLTQLYPNASVRVVDMRQCKEKFAASLSSYYSVETNYRLLVLSELFEEYEKVIYLDSDMVVLQDILQLEETDMQGYPLAACKDYSMYLKQYAKGAVFFNNEPGSVEHYCREILGLDGYEGYFNAGLVVFDTAACRREGLDVERALELLHEQNWVYNDQDVLNMLFAGNICYLDVKWNYIYDYDKYVSYPPAALGNLYQKVHREKPAILHYIGGQKPWNHAPHVMEHIFWNEVRALEETVLVWAGRYPKPERTVPVNKPMTLRTKRFM